MLFISASLQYLLVVVDLRGIFGSSFILFIQFNSESIICFKSHFKDLLDEMFIVDAIAVKYWVNASEINWWVEFNFICLSLFTSFLFFNLS